MITGWIIQPQIDKLSEQRKQLDSLRVDMKVESIITKRELAYKKMLAAQKEFEKTVEGIRKLQKMFQIFRHIAYTQKSNYPNGGYIEIDANPISGLQQGIYREFIYTPKKNINGNN